MRRDLYLMERILYRGEEELGNAPAPQLKTVSWHFLLLSDL